MSEGNTNPDAIKIGRQLLEAREKHGLSISDVAGKTRIQRQYLSDLEQGNFSELPGDVYTRAFIQQFANAVGLDGNKIAGEFDKMLEAEIAAKREAEEEANQEQTSKPRKRPKEKKKKQPKKAPVEPLQPQEKFTTAQASPSRVRSRKAKKKGGFWKKSLSVIGVIVLLVIIVLIVWVAANKMSKPDGAGDHSSIAVSRDSRKSSAPQPQPAKKKATNTKITSTSPNDFNVKTAQKNSTITIIGSPQKAFASVSLGGKTLWSGNLAAGEKHTVAIPNNLGASKQPVQQNTQKPVTNSYNQTNRTMPTKSQTNYRVKTTPANTTTPVKTKQEPAAKTPVKRTDAPVKQKSTVYAATQDKGPKGETVAVHLSNASGMKIQINGQNVSLKQTASQVRNLLFKFI